MNNLFNLTWPITAEEDHADRVYEQHRDCGCEGIAEPCECFEDCFVCEEVQDRIRYTASRHVEPCAHESALTAHGHAYCKFCGETL